MHKPTCLTSSDTHINLIVHKIAQHHDQRAFRLLFDHFYPRLFSYAKLILKSPSLAEEVVSDVFVKVWEQRSRLASVQNLNSYLFIVTKHQALNQLRSDSRHLSFSTDPYFPEQSGQHDDNPEQVYLAAEYAHVVQEAIQKLPHRCQAVFKMVRQDQLSYKEVAVLLDISPRTVEHQLAKAMDRIRQAVHQYTNCQDTRSYLLTAIKHCALLLLFFA